MAGAWSRKTRAAVRAMLTAVTAGVVLVSGVFGGISAAAMGVGGVPAQPVPGDVAATGIVAAADLSTFQAGNIIGDAVFFNKSSMTEAQIQSFLESKVPTCQSGYVCLKDWYDTSRSTTADAMCGAYSGGVRERASRIIYKVAQACGINPQVILATLQKEQGLVTHVWPSDWRYTIAMGQGCPDTAACDTRYYGFFNQVYGAAWQFKRYANPPGTSQYFTWYAPGKSWNVLYHPNRACGTTPVVIQNQATANLYYYTPYQPNAAALRAGYGTGDGCSSYGNRNFYNYFTDWFGSTQYSSFTAAPAPTVSGAAVAGQVLTAAAGTWAPQPSKLSYQWLKGGQPISGATGTTLRVTNDLAGSALTVRVTATRPAYATTSKTSGAVTAQGYATDRLGGASRYETAVSVSQRANVGTVATVYLASGADYPDALSAAAVAARDSAALLLTPAASLPAAVAGELRRLAPQKVVLVGGTGVLDQGTEARVKTAVGAAGVVIERVAGIDRYETSRQLAARFATAPTVYLATGRDFADALGAAAVAGSRSAPVVLVDGTAKALGAEERALLAALGTKSVVIVGGEGAVAKGIADQLAGLQLAVVRHQGKDRYETNAALNVASFAAPTPHVYTATGMDFPDALTGSVLAGGAGAPLLISRTDCAAGTLTDFLRSHAATALTLVGGTGALSSQVAVLRRC